jgi:hypothetical protein
MATMKGKRVEFFQIEFHKILLSSLWETWRICFMFLWKLWFYYGSMSIKLRIVERFCEEISWLEFSKSQKRFMECMKSEFTFFHKLSVMVDRCGRWLKMTHKLWCKNKRGAETCSEKDGQAQLPHSPVPLILGGNKVRLKRTHCCLCAYPHPRKARIMKPEGTAVSR